jgi:hypothetical protein
MNNYDELRDPDLASTHLANHLNDGTLVLFLGAGASKRFGLPNWVELVNALRLQVGLLANFTKDNSAEELQRGADEVLHKVKHEVKLIELVRKELYSMLVKLDTAQIFANPSLLAVASLLMGSKRGHISRVVTLNYDNLLQWFLSIYGFSVRTIHELPELEGSEDVRIYHPHGFVPVDGSGFSTSDFIILGLNAANRRLGTPGDLWVELVRHQLNSGVCIFLGMSQHTLSDRALAGLFSTCGEKCRPHRPLGVWLLLEDLLAGKDVEFQKNNIVPIQFTDPQKVAEFLFEICKKAGKRLIR